MNELVNRVLKPAAIPLVAAAFIGVLVFSFSRILLAVPEVGSTTLAFLISAEIVGVCGVIAAGSKLKGAQKAMLGILSLGLIAGGGASAAIGVRDIEAHKAGIPILAKGTAFNVKTLEVPAGTEFVIEFNNQDPLLHNVAIYEDKTAADVLFKGEVFSGPATRAYDVPPIPAGTFFFQCDVHPAMNGDVVATPGAGGHGGPAASPSPGGGAPPPPPAQPATDVTVVAQNIQFDKKQLDLVADAEVTLTLDNQDAGILHNLAIYRGPDASAPAILDEPEFPGPESRTWTIPASPAGSYYFQCDVHPNMNGTAIFH